MNSKARELFKNLLRNGSLTRAVAAEPLSDRRLACEGLEQRQLMAADLAWGTEVSPGVFEANGEEGADTFVFEAGTEEHVLTWNGISQTVEASEFARFIFNANDDEDSIHMVGLENSNDTFKAWTDRAELKGDGYEVDTNDFRQRSADALSGNNDRSYLYGTEGVDNFLANPSESQLVTSDGAQAIATGFDRMYAEGYGGDDQAHFVDGAGDDKVRMYETNSRLISDESYVRANDFERVSAEAINGGYDKAYQYDTSGSDLLIVNEDSVRMLSEGKDSSATGFERNYSYSRNGGDDYLRVYDSVFDDDFDLASIMQDRGRKNGVEAQATFFRLFGGNFYRRAEGFLVSDMLEVNPRYLIGDTDSNGAVDVNIDYASGVSDLYYIEMQRYGAELIVAGLGVQSEAMIADGMQVIQWGLDQQAADGSFPNSDDMIHSTSMFLEALGRSIEELDLFDYEGFDSATRSEWVDGLSRMANWMVNNDDTSAHVDLEPFSHRYFLRAAGLMRASQLTGEANLATEANAYFSAGLGTITEDGVMLERDGFDLNYQTIGLRYAGELYRMSNDTMQREAIRIVFEDSLPWIDARIDEDGNADMSDSSRADETTRNGGNKGFDEISAVRAYLSGYEITGNTTWLEMANAVFQHDKTA
ncbi:MAG: hypothetical protein AAF483_23385 [Planctomycetota bacterium]